MLRRAKVTSRITAGTLRLTETAITPLVVASGGGITVAFAVTFAAVVVVKFAAVVVVTFATVVGT